MNCIACLLSLIALLLTGCSLSPISPTVTSTVTPQPTPSKTPITPTATLVPPTLTPVPEPEIRPGEIVQDPRFVLEGARLINTEEAWKRIIDCFIVINMAKEKPLITKIAEEAGTSVEKMDMELMYDYFKKGAFDAGDNRFFYMRTKYDIYLDVSFNQNTRVDLSQINLSVVEGSDEYALWKNSYRKNGPLALIEMDDDNGFYADESNRLVLGGLVPYNDGDNVLRFTLVVYYVRPGRGSQKYFPTEREPLTNKHLEGINNIFSAHMYSYILVSSIGKHGVIDNDFFIKTHKERFALWGGGSEIIGAPPAYYKDFSNYVKKYGPPPGMIPNLLELSDYNSSP